MDEIGRAYLSLALDIDRHLEGFVDAYFGPPELQAQTRAGEPRLLSILADDVRQLQAAVKDSDYDPQRKDFLARQTRAMAAVIRNLSGDQLEFVEEVQQYFDITPQMVDEGSFEQGHAVLDRLLPGDGPVFERLAEWEEGLQLEPDLILPVFEVACAETRRRTQDLFDLPPGEDLSLHIVQNQPWGAYNWYLGNYRSCIDLNIDVPPKVSGVVPLMTHEAYAGHHTEHATKEYHLYRQQGRGEHAVQLLLAPECVLSEGIADSAHEILFGDADLASFLRDELYPRAGLSTADVERQIRIGQVAQTLRGVGGNAALLLHRDGWSPERVQQYVERYALRTPLEAARTISFIGNPLFRSYIFNYATGKALLASLLSGPDAVANFRRLLCEPFTPTQVRQWVTKRKTS